MKSIILAFILLITSLTLLPVVGFFCCDYSYEKKGGKVYFVVEDSYGKDKIRLKGVDPKSFRTILDHETFARDENNVFCESQKAEGADPDTVKIVDGKDLSFLIDKNSVFYIYFGCEKIPGLTSEGFRIVEEYADADTYIADKKHVVYGDTSRGKVENWIHMKGADADSLVSIDRNLAKDKYNVYYRGKKIEGITPKDLTGLSVKEQIEIIRNSTLFKETQKEGQEKKTGITLNIMDSPTMLIGLGLLATFLFWILFRKRVFLLKKQKGIQGEK